MFHKKNWTARTIISAIVGVSFVCSIVYAIIHLLFAPSVPKEALPFEKLRSDYALMILQCLLGLFMLYLPQLLKKKWKSYSPILCTYFSLYSYIVQSILGKFEAFYTVPNWDTILHALSAAALATLGFNLVSLLNDAKQIKMQMSPFFIAFFAFCFAVCAGSLWKSTSLPLMGILGFNMQKYATLTHVDLIGRAALMDTMKDIIVDSLSALVISILGYCQLKVVTFRGRKIKLPNMEGTRIVDGSPSSTDLGEIISTKKAIFQQSCEK